MKIRGNKKEVPDIDEEEEQEEEVHEVDEGDTTDEYEQPNLITNDPHYGLFILLSDSVLKSQIEKLEVNVRLANSILFFQNLISQITQLF